MAIPSETCWDGMHLEWIDPSPRPTTSNPKPRPTTVALPLSALSLRLLSPASDLTSTSTSTRWHPFLLPVSPLEMPPSTSYLPPLPLLLSRLMRLISHGLSPRSLMFPIIKRLPHLSMSNVTRSLTTSSLRISLMTPLPTPLSPTRRPTPLASGQAALGLTNYFHQTYLVSAQSSNFSWNPLSLLSVVGPFPVGRRALIGMCIMRDIIYVIICAIYLFCIF